MKYRRIDKDTVQCIVTGEDLEEYGLSMTDIFERNEQGEGFLRDLIEGAHEEVGYNCSGKNIAMQISPFKDNGMVITFSEEPETSFKNFLEHMKQLLESGGEAGDFGSNAVNGAGDKKGSQSDEGYTDENAWKEAKPKHVGTSTPRLPEKQDQVAETRIFEFSSIVDLLDFAKGLPNPSQVRSCLLKCDGMFYIIVMKNRMSWENFNRMSAMAFDFGNIIFDSSEKLIYLGEHSELLIGNGALNKLSKIG